MPVLNTWIVQCMKWDIITVQFTWWALFLESLQNVVTWNNRSHLLPSHFLWVRGSGRASLCPLAWRASQVAAFRRYLKVQEQEAGTAGGWLGSPHRLRVPVGFLMAWCLWGSRCFPGPCDYCPWQMRGTSAREGSLEIMLNHFHHMTLLLGGREPVCFQGEET